MVGTASEVSLKMKEDDDLFRMVVESHKGLRWPMNGWR